MPLQRIGDKINRSKFVIFTFFQNLFTYVTRKKSQGRRKFLRNDPKKFFRMFTNKRMSTKETGSNIKTLASMWTERRSRKILRVLKM